MPTKSSNDPQAPARPAFEIPKRSIFERVLKVFMESNLDIAYWDDDCKVELAEAVAKELDPNG